MKETMYEITYLQTQLLSLDMLRAKVSAELNEIYKNVDMEVVKSIIVDEELMRKEHPFTENDQCEAIFEVTGKSLTFEELRDELFGDLNE